MKNDKYEFTGETKRFRGHTLHRIRAKVDFGIVKAGDLGGWIEDERNLSALMGAWVYGEAIICNNAVVRNSTDYIVFKNCWSSMRWFTYTRSNRKWKVGCFLGTGDELIKKAYADSKKSGKCYEAIVKTVEAIETAMQRLNI